MVVFGIVEKKKENITIILRTITDTRKSENVHTHKQRKEIQPEKKAEWTEYVIPKSKGPQSVQAKAQARPMADHGAGLWCALVHFILASLCTLLFYQGSLVCKDTATYWLYIISSISPPPLSMIPSHWSRLNGPLSDFVDGRRVTKNVVKQNLIISNNRG